LIRNNVSLVGFLILSSLFVPPNLTPSVLGIDISDVLVLLAFFILLYSFVISKNKKFGLFDFSYLTITLFYFLFSSIYTELGLDIINTTNLRFVFFFLLSYLLFRILITNHSNLDEINFFKTFYILIPINFIFIFLKDSVNIKDVGWISANIDTNNLYLSGRLAGLQGSGPNVFGLISAISVVYFLHKILNHAAKNILLDYTMLLISFVCLIFSKSRGSYISLFLVFTFLALATSKVNKKNITTLFLLFISTIFLLFTFSPETFLKSSDRNALSRIGLDNVRILKGTGGGNYIYDLFRDSLNIVSLIKLEESNGINVSKVESDIFPDSYFKDKRFLYNFGSQGFNLLEKYEILDECENESRICQLNKLKRNQAVNFFRILKNYDQNIEKNIINYCFQDNQMNSYITRLEFACFNSEINKNIGLNHNLPKSEFQDVKFNIAQYFLELKEDKIYASCDFYDQFACPKRVMTTGELSYIVDNLIENNLFSENIFQNYCNSCNRNFYETFLRLKFDYKDGILPRTKIQFFISTDGKNWEKIGDDKTNGKLINLQSNNSFIEVGGWADGQSFGNTWLEGIISEMNITSENGNLDIIFDKKNLNSTYFLFKPNTVIQYNDSKELKFNSNGLISYSPNKYWIAIPNDSDLFVEDFTIDLHLFLTYVPSKNQTLVSSTSLFNDGKHSWKWYIYDSRLFFEWADENGVYSSKLGDLSLTSGVIYTGNQYLYGKRGEITSNSNLNQITTSHNGYLTFTIEYGLMISTLIFGVIFIVLYKSIQLRFYDKLSLLVLLIFLIQNMSNDLIYSPDASIFLWTSLSFLLKEIYFSNTKFSNAKS
jgi:hypothetical protein